MNKEQLEFEMQVRKTIKTALKNLLKQTNLSQQEFAKMFKFSQKSVSNWLNCKSTAKVKYLIKICKFYKLKLSYFLGA